MLYFDDAAAVQLLICKISVRVCLITNYSTVKLRARCYCWTSFYFVFFVSCYFFVYAVIFLTNKVEYIMVPIFGPPCVGIAWTGL